MHVKSKMAGRNEHSDAWLQAETAEASYGDAGNRFFLLTVVLHVRVVRALLVTSLNLQQALCLLACIHTYSV